MEADAEDGQPPRLGTARQIARLPSFAAVTAAVNATAHRLGAEHPVVALASNARKDDARPPRIYGNGRDGGTLSKGQPGRKPLPFDPSDKADRVDRNVFPDLLCQLGDGELVRRFLVKVMPADGGVQLGESFAKLWQQQGWGSFEAELTAVIETMTDATVARNAELLQALCEGRENHGVL